MKHNSSIIKERSLGCVIVYELNAMIQLLQVDLPIDSDKSLGASHLFSFFCLSAHRSFMLLIT